MPSVDDSYDTGPIPQPVEVIRAFLLQYVVDRVGRPAPVESRALVHDALDQLENERRAVA